MNNNHETSVLNRNLVIYLHCYKELGSKATRIIIFIF